MAEIETETFMLASPDPGVQLHLRNKHASGQSQFPANRIVLFVHGATFPAETGFDFAQAGGSWMDIAADQGFDAYCIDVRGYGRSTRPATMAAPPQDNPPFADTQDAVRDVGTAVEFILRRRGVAKLNLVGWSWGTAITATFTVQNNAKIERLVLYAPLSVIRGVPAVTGQGAYRTTGREASRARGIRGIPAERVEEISPRAEFDRWFDANLATDPHGAAQSPPVLRSPNGVVKDIANYWGQGRSTYDPEQIRVPTLIVVGEWDQDTPLYMAQDVFARMLNSPDKRMLVLGEGTHAMVLEKHRMRLINAVQQFLAEC